MEAMRRLCLSLLLVLGACGSTPVEPEAPPSGWEDNPAEGHPRPPKVPVVTPEAPRPPETPPGTPVVTPNTPVTAPVVATGELVVRVIDVGQGDGMLIVSPTGKSILVDAGDQGAYGAMLDQLAASHITQLDLVVMSHPHADHIGAMTKVLAKVPTKMFLDPGYDDPSPVYADLLAFLARTKTPIVIARAGRRIDIGGGAYLDILLPEEPLLAGTRSDANANSIVMRLVHGGASMLFTGDSEAPTEDRLTGAMTSIRSDVLKVAHHGSRFSTQDGFLAAVDPTIAVISCGVRNRFDHPQPSTIAKLEHASAAIWRTDLQGTITLISDGKRWRVSAPGKKSVDAGGHALAEGAHDGP